jgi:hypothetical protein
VSFFGCVIPDGVRLHSVCDVWRIAGMVLGGGGSHCHAFHTWIGPRMKPGLRSKIPLGCSRQLCNYNFTNYGGGYCIISCHEPFELTNFMIGPLAINSLSDKTNSKTLEQSVARSESRDSSWVFLFTWQISKGKLKGDIMYFNPPPSLSLPLVAKNFHAFEFTQNV